MKDTRVRESVLYAFAVEPKHDRETLERYLRQHPDLAEDLVDLSSELRQTEAYCPSAAGNQADPGWEAAWAEFVACEPPKTVPLHKESLFARFKGRAFAELAGSLGIPRSILTALRDRLVEPSSIPERFVSRFAALADSTVGAVREYFFTATCDCKYGGIQGRQETIPAR